MTESARMRVPEFTFGDRLRKAREDAGLGLHEFAKEIGISPTTVTAYERRTSPHGTKRPTLLVWSMRTNVDLDWLLSGKVPRDGGPGDDGRSMDTSGYGYPVAA